MADWYNRKCNDMMGRLLKRIVRRKNIFSVL